jgi:hypothetical protein
MRRFLLPVLAALAACTPMQWAKPDADAEQIARDEKACRDLAWREANVRASLYPVGPVFVPDSMGRGAMSWPSGANVDPFGYQMVEENRLAQSCMEARGYSFKQ